MALVSPGLEVQVIDESTYLASAISTIPLVVIATEENKVVNGQIAVGTLKENANKLAVITSQRELVNLYGFPEFKKSVIGTALHGDELNEYGLMAAYSALGVGNRAYVVRADIDLSEIAGTPNRPVGEPSDGSYWLDTTESEFGMFQWNSVSKKFMKVIPRVITSYSDLDEYDGIYAPKNSIGSIGEYAVVITEDDSTIRGFYKGSLNEWNLIGSDLWMRSIPTLVSENSNPTLEVGNSVFINGTLVEAQTTLVEDFSALINAAEITGVQSSVINGNLVLYADSTAASNSFLIDGAIKLENGTGNMLFDLGLPENELHYSPRVHVASYTSLPAWGVIGNIPSNSIWIKTSAIGDGMDISLKSYNRDESVWTTIAIPSLTDYVTVPSFNQDSSGVFSVVNRSAFPSHEIKLLKKKLTEKTTVTFTPNANFSTGQKFGITVSNSLGQVRSYTVTLTGSSVEFFVANIQEKNIPEIRVSINSSGQVVIQNIEDGIINLYDVDGDVIATSGLSYSTAGTWPLKDKFGFTSNIDGQRLLTRTQSQYYITEIPPSNPVDDDRWVDASRGLEYYWDSLSENWIVSDETRNFYIREFAPEITNTGITSLWVNPTQGRMYMSVSDQWVHIWSYGMNSVGIYASGVDPLVYAFGSSAPTTRPQDGTLWYYNDRAEVDILINTGTQWKGYRNVGQDVRGYSLVDTDPAGIIVSASEPIEQSDGSDLVPGDLWLDSSDVKNYPRIYRRTNDESWELIDKTDQVSENGIIFADVRWGTSGDIDPIVDAIPSIQSMAVSDYVDLDAPDPRLYPTGMLVFNLRRSGYSIKRYARSYFNSVDFPNVTLPSVKDTWVTASGLQNDGSMFAGPQAQRNMVVSAMRAAIDTNETIREDQWQFSLITAPGYPELIGNMVALNKDRAESAFVIGDTPMDLPPNMVDITNWMNANLTIPDAYLGVFYPSGLSTDLSGNEIAVPPSHMILRTVMRSDNVSFPWFAPAGARRGLIDNATTIGTIDPNTGEFGRFSVNRGLRDALYEAKINPLTILPGTGLLNYGQKTRYGLTSALDRINVARLINYIRTALQPLANNFLFEPNDKIVRDQIKQSVEGLMNDLVAKRALYDYLVVVDESNNTPDRIARNELYVDIAIAPVRTVEFIYIPLRIRNPGDI